MKKIFLTIGLLLTLSVSFGQTFITKRVSVTGTIAPSATEWIVSDSLITYRSLDPKVIKQGGGGEYKLVVERVVKNPGGSLYYTQWNGMKIRISVALSSGKYVVNYEIVDDFTGKVTQILYY